MEERLQKYLAESGIASRRKSEELILQGKVKVNGQVVTKLGMKIDPKKDQVQYMDKEVSKVEVEMIYIMLHKPEGYVTTSKEQFGRPGVMDLVKGIKTRVYPVGRLDYDTSGLLLLTNDGDLTFKLTHPKHDVDKTYIAKVYGTPNDMDLQKFRRGVHIDGERTKPAKIMVLEKGERQAVVEISIHEGRNRQVRKMCEEIKHPIAQLQRVATGELKLGDLAKGKHRHLTPAEVKYLKNL